MVAFPLANLNSTLLEMVISKLDHRSYFYMQQTCRGMMDFIRRNKKISVHLKGYYNAEYIRDEIFCYKAYVWHPVHIDPDTLYGTRLPSLYICGETSFEYICDCLKKYRLTFEEVDISTDKWTKEQILTILKMTKPLTIVLNSEGSNGYEALFHSKSLETVNANLIPEQVATAVPKLLIAFSVVIIKVDCSEVQLELFFPVLQFLLSQPLPNLREFDFCATGNIDRINTNRDALEEQFREFNLTVKANDGPCIDVELPPHFPDGIFCKVTLEGNYVQLYCGMGDVTD